MMIHFAKTLSASALKLLLLIAIGYSSNILAQNIAFVVMQIAEKGVVELDEPLYKYTNSSYMFRI